MSYVGNKLNPSAPSLQKYGLHKDLPSDSDSDDQDYMPNAPLSCTDSSSSAESVEEIQIRKKKLTFSSIQFVSDDDSEDSDYNPYEKHDTEKQQEKQVQRKKAEKRRIRKRSDDNSESSVTPPVKKKKKLKKIRKFGDVNNSDDDSDDSDYCRHSAYQVSIKKKEANRNNKNSKAVRKNIVYRHPTKPASDTWATLPIEILSEIFQIVAKIDCHGFKYVIRCSQVCKAWNHIATQPVSWKYADLAFLGGNNKAKDALLIKLCENMFENIEVLFLSGWRKLTDNGLINVANHCRKLEVLNIAYCQFGSIAKISAESLIPIAENCPLKRINFSNIRISLNYGKTVSNFLEICGKNLTHINFSGNISFSSQVFNTILKNCNELIVIDVSSTSIRSICFETFQTSCPKLQELYLANLLLEPKRVSGKNTQGFPDLQICSLATSNKTSWLNDSFVAAILKTSARLKLLDLRGGESLTEESFNIPAGAVERLYLSHCHLSKEAIKKIFTKWRDSLWDIDLSWITIFGMTFDLLMITNDVPWNDNIQYLNLAGTSVSDTGVEYILKRLKNLKMIDLTSCRGISRGFKRLHDGHNDIKNLRKFMLEDVN